MKSAKVLLPLLALVMVAGLTKACGSRMRTADLNVSLADIDSQLQTLRTQATTLGDESQMLDAFLNMTRQDGASIYYSEAPGSLGSIENVMPLDWFFLNFRNAANVPTAASQIRAYFVTVPTPQGLRGGLLLEQYIGSSIVPVVLLNDTNIANPMTQSPIMPGEMTDIDFTMDLARSREVVVTARSTDIYDGDLTNVIQLELWDYRSGYEDFAGLINLVQPK